MNTVEHLTSTYGSGRSVDDLSLVRPGRLSRLVIVSVRSILATTRFGPRPLPEARRTPTA
jgi:hypothetical protein